MGTGIASVINGVVSNVVGEYQRRKQNKFNREEAEKNRRYQSDMYHYNNWYNSPQNQKALLKQAGLNPNMVYSSGGQPLGSASSPSGDSASSGSYSPGSQAIGLDPVSKAQAELLHEEAEGQRIKNDNMQTEYNVSFDLSRANAKYLYSQSDLSDAEITKIAQDIRESEQRINESLSRVDVNTHVMELYDAQTEAQLFANKRYNEVIDTHLANLSSQTKKNLADAGLSAAKQKEILQMLPLIQEGKEIENANERLRGTGLEYSNGQLKISLDNLPYRLRLENANLKQDLKNKSSEVYRNYYSSMSELAKIVADITGTGGYREIHPN